MIRSFPYPGLAVVPPSLSKDFVEAADIRSFVDANLDIIQKFTNEVFTKGGNIQDLYVMLGKACAIKILNTTEFRRGNLKIVSFLAGTSSWHGVDGINNWALIHDVETNEVFMMNVLIGEHLSLFMDLMNNVIGELLMGTVRQTILDALEAQERGMHILEYLRQHNPELYKNHALFALLDRTFVTEVAYLRKWLGGNTMVDLDKTIDLTPKDPNSVGEFTLDDIMMGTFPETGKPAGLYFGEGEISINLQNHMTLGDCTTAGDNVMNPVSKQQQKTATDIVTIITLYNQSRQAVEDLKANIVAVVNNYLPQNVDKLETVQTIYDKMKSDPSFVAAIYQQIHRTLANPETMAGIKDQISTHPDFGNLQTTNNFLGGDFGECVNQIANDHVYKHVILELTKPEGLVHMWASQRIEEHIRPNLAAFDLDLAVKEKLQDLQEKEKFVDQAKQNRQNLAVGDPRVQEADRELWRSQEALEEAKIAMDGASDMHDLQQNEEQRQTQRQKEENDERDRIFQPPHPEEGRS